jgi:hypothetical protein
MRFARAISLDRERRRGLAPHPGGGARDVCWMSNPDRVWVRPRRPCRCSTPTVRWWRNGGFGANQAATVAAAGRGQRHSIIPPARARRRPAGGPRSAHSQFPVLPLRLGRAAAKDCTRAVRLGCAGGSPDAGASGREPGSSVDALQRARRFAGGSAPAERAGGRHFRTRR